MTQSIRPAVVLLIRRLVVPKQEIEIPEVNFHSLLEIISMKETMRNVRSNLPAEEQTINIFGGALTIELANMSLDDAATTPASAVQQPVSPTATPEVLKPEECAEFVVANGATSDKESRQGSPSPSPATSATPASAAAAAAPRRTNPEAGIWVTSCGIYYFKLSQLSTQHQLLYSLLKELYRVSDIDAFYHLLISIKLLVLHADCLELAAKEQKGFLIFSLEKMLVPKSVENPLFLTRST